MRLIAQPMIVLAVAAICAAGSPSAAQDFRIETDVFVGEETDPAIETLTIFADNVVYDFLLTGVEEITLFDQPRDRLVLMDTQRKVKTELTMEAMLAFVAQLKVHLNGAQRKYLLADGLKMEQGEDGWFTLTNDRVTYRAEGIKPKFQAAAVQYQQFADWYARLNAMRLGNLPPFARIRLNAELASRGLIPKTIERTLVRTKGLREIKDTVRSRQLANWRLSTTDRKRIDRAGTYLATFPTVTFREYLQIPAVAATPGPKKR